MARQDGPLQITGTIGGICFYKMDRKYYARAKSSLSGKRVKKDPAFKKTMEFAGLLGRSSKFAAKLKTGLTIQERKKINHSKLTGRVQRLLKEGKTELDILAMLRPDLVPAVPSPKVKVRERQAKPGEASFAEQAIRNAFEAEENKPLNAGLSNGLTVVEQLMNRGYGTGRHRPEDTIQRGIIT